MIACQNGKEALTPLRADACCLPIDYEVGIAAAQAMQAAREQRAPAGPQKPAEPIGPELPPALSLPAV